MKLFYVKNQEKKRLKNEVKNKISINQVDKYCQMLSCLRIGTNMYGKLQNSLNMETFIGDMINVCL